METYDVIVIGLGAMGSAATYHLAKRNLKVLGLEMYEPAHSIGSSHGKSRIIREAYAEAPEYVPLVKRAYLLWQELEREVGTELLTITGGITAGVASGELVSGALASAKTHNIPYSYLSAGTLNEKYPAFGLPADFMAVYEARAGLLNPEKCILAHLEIAARYGAKLHYNEQVLSLAADTAGGVTVKTARATYQAARLVITTGPWASELLAELALPLRVERMVNVWFEPEPPAKARFRMLKCPVYLIETPGEIESLREVLNTYLPGAAGRARDSLTCMYTNTPDYNFIVDTHPKYPQVVFACGFSGHGFKFASAIGEVLASLVTTGNCDLAVEFLSLARF